MEIKYSFCLLFDSSVINHSKQAHITSTGKQALLYSAKILLQVEKIRKICEIVLKWVLFPNLSDFIFLLYQKFCSPHLTRVLNYESELK